MFKIVISSTSKIMRIHHHRKNENDVPDHAENIYVIISRFIFKQDPYNNGKNHDTKDGVSQAICRHGARKNGKINFPGYSKITLKLWIRGASPNTWPETGTLTTLCLRTK